MLLSNLQLALTHPSYMMNYGTNPDHARNTLSNCGVKKPRYGDKRNRFKYAKKKGEWTWESTVSFSIW